MDLRMSLQKAKMIRVPLSTAHIWCLGCSYLYLCDWSFLTMIQRISPSQSFHVNYHNVRKDFTLKIFPLV